LDCGFEGILRGRRIAVLFERLPNVFDLYVYVTAGVLLFLRIAGDSYAGKQSFEVFNKPVEFVGFCLGAEHCPLSGMYTAGVAITGIGTVTGVADTDVLGNGATFVAASR
jgi:hypothetical protein